MPPLPPNGKGGFCKEKFGGNAGLFLRLRGRGRLFWGGKSAILSLTGVNFPGVYILFKQNAGNCGMIIEKHRGAAGCSDM